MNINGSFKKKRNKFSQISNVVAWDKNLSMKAKGLYLLIESLINIPDFVLYKNTLKNKCKEGEKAFESAWKELKGNGYLKQEKHRDENGNFYYLYDLLDEPDHTPKKEVVGNAGVDKGGYIINTNLNKTYFNNTKSFKKLSQKVLSTLPFEKFIKQIPTDEYNQDKVDTIAYFLNKQLSITGKVNKIFTYDTWYRIYDNWLIAETDVAGDKDIDDIEDMYNMIDDFFNTDFKRKDCNYSIVLFEKTKGMRYLKCVMNI